MSGTAVSLTDSESFANSYLIQNETLVAAKFIPQGEPFGNFIYLSIRANNTGEDGVLDGMTVYISLLGDDPDTLYNLTSLHFNSTRPEDAAAATLPACNSPADSASSGLFTCYVTPPTSVPSVKLDFFLSWVSGGVEVNHSERVPILSPVLVLPFEITTATTGTLRLAAGANGVALDRTLRSVFVLEECPPNALDQSTWEDSVRVALNVSNPFNATAQLPELLPGTYYLLLESDLQEWDASDWFYVVVTTDVDQSYSLESSSDSPTGVWGIPFWVWYTALIVLIIVICVAFIVVCVIAFVSKPQAEKGLTESAETPSALTVDSEEQPLLEG